MEIACKSCRRLVELEQPYAYHAGFADQGFLYNEAGTLTLVWSSFDDAYEHIVPHSNPWALTPEQRSDVERQLAPAPSGGRWLFSNPARCPSCAAQISAPITETIYYLVYPGSLVLDGGPEQRRFSEVLQSAL
jgi:hypothetical protein